MNKELLAAAPPQAVKLEAVDDSPGPYCMSFGFDLTPLTESIREVGLVNPPVLVRDNHGSISVVAGFRRVKAMKMLHMERSFCRVLPRERFSHIDCLLMNLHENLTVRDLNHVEKAMVLARLARWLKSSEIVSRYMAMLGLSSSQSLYSLYLRFEERMEIEGKQAVALGSLSFRNAIMLLDLDRSSRTAIVDLASNIKLTVNQQRQLIELADDLAHIEARSIQEILNDEGITAIRLNTRMNDPQKGRALINFLRLKRFPTLSRAEKDFNGALSSLHLGKRVRIDHSPAFEFPLYRLEVLFRDGVSLRKKLGRLMKEDLNLLRDPWKK